MTIKHLLFITFFSLLTVVMRSQDFPVIELQPLDQAVCEGDSAVFVIEASGEGEIEYQWQKEETDLEGATDSIFIISAVSLNDSGDYRCIVSNDNGSDTTDVASLYVDHVLSTQLLGPHEVENYDTALFSIVYTPNHSYQYEVLQGTVVELTDTTVLVEWGEDKVGYVNVVESSENGCYGDTVSRLVIVGNVVPFFLSQPESQIACMRDSVSFEAPAAGTSDLHYQWQFNGEDILRETYSTLTIPSVKLENKGEYRCIVTNTVGADTSDIAELDIDYVEPAEINGENMVDETDTITYNIIPVEGHSYDFDQMGGTTIETSDTSITVLWDTPGISNIQLVETNTRGCQSDTVDYQVLVFGEGTMIIFFDQPESKGVCVDDSASFTVHAAGYPVLIYQWQKNSEDIEGATDSIFTIYSAQLDDEADYRCIVSNDFGVDTTDAAHLSVDEIEPSYIMGPQYVKEFEVADYSLPYTDGHAYQFEVDGGNIIETNLNTITVHWGGSGYGRVSGLESLVNGCVGEWVDLTVYVGAVGVESLTEKTPLVYPNPVNDFITIRSEGKHTFRLYNLVGNLVMKKEFENETRLNLSYLDQGIYLYKIDQTTGRLVK